MNILVVCHIYKKHELLTLINGPTDNDYIYLTPDNIRNIFSLTNGSIANISFIDTGAGYVQDDYVVKDNFQYNDWTDIPDGSVDAFYTIYCPPFDLIQDYGSKLKRTGKIIDVKPDKMNAAKLYVYDDDFFPFIVKPLSPRHEKTFGPYIYTVKIYNKSTQETEVKNVRFNIKLIPIVDDYGEVIIPITPAPATKAYNTITQEIQNKSGRYNTRSKKGGNKSKKGKKSRKSRKGKKGRKSRKSRK